MLGERTVLTLRSAWSSWSTLADRSISSTVSSRAQSAARSPDSWLSTQAHVARVAGRSRAACVAEAASSALQAALSEQTGEAVQSSWARVTTPTYIHIHIYIHTHTHTHIRLTALFPGLPR